MNPARSLLTGAVRAAARLRRARTFHPAGAMCVGFATLGDEDLPLRSGAVTLRISKGLGTPGGLPDIVGVAVRLQTSSPGGSADGDWDVLLAGRMPGLGPLPVPAPARTWHDVPLSSISRFRYDGEDWRIDGRLLVPRLSGGLSVPRLRGRLLRANGVLALGARGRSGSTRPLGTVNFTAEAAGSDLRFDPVRAVPDGVRPVPDWLARLRADAYRASRDACTG